MNPLTQLATDREHARGLDDPYTGTCTLALATPDGKASARTLVLREITDTGLTLFLNQSSPKWAVLESGGSLEILIYYATIEVQYRIQGSHTLLPRDVIETNWPRRPTPAKYLDYVYAHVAPQSSVVPDRATLTGHFAKVRATYPDTELSPPEGALGLLVTATEIERLNLRSPDRIHDRRRHVLTDGQWAEQILVP